MSVKIISSNNKDGYDAWSSFYDNFPNPTVAIDELHFPKRWVHLTSQDILEVGCGTGRHTSKLIKQNNRVVGIDLSAGMLEIARKRLSNAALLIIGDESLGQINSAWLKYINLPMIKIWELMKT